MIPENFRPNIGDDLEAKDHWSIDPENIQPQSAGFLTGGTGHSALSVFQSLGAGANNGKFKINVDGIEYDNIAPSLSVLNVADISQTVSNLQFSLSNSTTRLSQSFVLTEEIKITTISLSMFMIGTVYSGASAYIYACDENDKPTGSVLATSSNIATITGVFAFSFNTLLPAGKYCIVTSDLPRLSSSDMFTCDYSTSSTYANGKLAFSTNSGSSWTVNDTNDLYFVVTFEPVQDRLNYTIQKAIRTATGSTETFIYDTDHFIITSATANNSSQILKLMTPTTGTDISGAGATPYLDMAENGVETQGTGEEYNLVRLDDNGQIPNEILNTTLEYEIITSSVELTSGSRTCDITLTAPSGKKIVGGGASSSLNNDVVYVTSNYPVSSTQWNVKAYLSGSGYSTIITAHAICVKI